MFTSFFNRVFRCHLPMALLALFLMGAPGWARPPMPAQAAALATIVVNSTLGATDTSSSTCTLTEAINMANSTQNPPSNGCAQGSTSGADTITFSVSGVIRPASTLNIISAVTIVGPITISGNNQARIFTVSSNGTLSLRTLSIQDGNGGGGGAILSNQGTVVVDRVTFRNNVGSSEGGAINSSGTLRITDSTFENNRTTGSNGGAIAHSGSSPLVINRSTFTNNTALHNGGALYNTSSSAQILDVTFTDNRATGDAGRGGGAITNFTNGVMTIGRSHFAENSSPEGNGGAIFNALQTTLTMTSSSFLDNAAGAAASTNRYGGAIHSMGTLTIADSSLVSNQITGSGGAIANDRTGVLLLANTSLANNTASQEGGGLYNRNTQQGATAIPRTTAVNTTFAGNTSTINQGDNLFNGHESAAVSLNNTLVAAGSPNCNAAVRSLGHNLDSANTCGFTASGDRVNSDAKVAAPAFHGGPIPTLLSLKLEKGSQAIDNGHPSVCAAAPIGNKDQRGVGRPRDGDGFGGIICDIGAFEADTIVGNRLYIPLTKR